MVLLNGGKSKKIKLIKTLFIPPLSKATETLYVIMKEETQKNPNEVANEILTQHLEGKSYGFVKEVLSFIDRHLDIICTVPTLPK